MAFNNQLTKNVTTSATAVVDAPATGTKTLIGLSISNTTGSGILVDAYITKSGFNYYLIKNAPINAGGTLVVIGGDQKVVLNTTDTVYAVSSVATSADAVASFLL